MRSPAAASRSWSPRFARRARRRLQRLARRQLALEALEDRRLLAVDVGSSFFERVDFLVDDDASARQGIMVRNPTSDESIIINTDAANDVYGTSSTIKAGVLYTLLRRIDSDNTITLDTIIDVGSDYGTTEDRGDLTPGADLSLRELAEHMIDTSDNWAANRLMDFVEGRYDFDTDTWGPPGTFPVANAEFASLGLSSTRLDRYNTGTSAPSAHGSSGPVEDYRNGHDNESTPSEMVSLLEQIHQNAGLLSSESYEEFWRILNLNPFPTTTAEYREDPSPDDDSIIAGTGSGNWQNLMMFYSKSGSNTWTGNVGDFSDSPNLGSHFQRSEAGRVELDNGEFIFYAMFADESSDAAANEFTRSAIGYEFAVEYANPFVSFTPEGAELEDGRVLTVDLENYRDGDDASPDMLRFFRDGGDVVLEVNSDEVYRADFSEVDLIRVFGSSDDDEFVLDGSMGDVIPAGGVRVVGRTHIAAGDSLRIIGDGNDSGMYKPDAAINGDGTATVNGDTISFTGLEPIEISGMASYAFVTPNGSDSISIEDTTATGGEPAIRITGTSGGVGFEVPTFFDVATLHVDLATNDVVASADDHLAMGASGLGASGLAALTIDGGSGNDTFSVVGNVATTITVNGGAPVVGGPGVPPGDVLAVDASAFGGVSAPINQPNGVVTAAGMAPVIYTSIETLIASDRFEVNDTLAQATDLGSEPTTILRNLSIHSGDDTDFFELTAHDTGLLVIEARFLDATGDIDVNVRDGEGNVIATAASLTDNERLVIPVVGQETYFVEVVGFGNAINNYSLELENFAAPIPSAVDLAAASDTGTINDDDVTADTTPRILIQADIEGFADIDGDGTLELPILTPEQATAGATAGVAVEVLVTNILTGATTRGFARQVGTSGTLFEFTPDAPLADGRYEVAAAVRIFDQQQDAAQDPAPASRRHLLSVPLALTIDTQLPEVSFGQPGVPNDGLVAGSDSGLWPPSHAALVDRITNDTTPRLWGRAAANSIIRVYADVNGNGVLDLGTDVFLGQDTAIPADGSVQDPDGFWEISSVVNLNDPNFFPNPDGLRTLFVVAEDVVGNVNAVDGAGDTLGIFVDTVGPVVESVFISDAPDYNLFAPKPLADGPTPPVESLTIALSDLPDRLPPDFDYALLQETIAAQLGHYRVIGDHNGIIPIESLELIEPDAGGTIWVRLHFADPLPDDRYTLSVADAIVDVAGNRLDGENNASEPQEIPLFPTGDGIPGGGFLARFTVDSRPEFGTVSQGSVYVDINGNFVFDPDGKDGDFTNRDFVFDFGQLTDAHFAGDFAPAGAAASSGFDKLGVYGQFNGRYQFYLDTDDDGVGDFASLMPNAYQINALPVAGDFDPDHPGDEIGAFDGQNWYLDVNGNNRIDLGERFSTSMRGLPLVGDFNGDGNDDLATYNNDTGRFYFDLDGNPATIEESWSGGFSGIGGFSGFGEKPLSGDFNLDGIDDIVMWTPGREGVLPKEAGEFMMLLSDRAGARPSEVFDTYSPAPLGNDRFAQFGDEFALPVFGNFDPPVQPNDSGDPPPSLTNASNPLDVDGNGLVSPLDALRVVNYLNRGSEGEVTPTPRALATFGDFRPDANRDGRISPLDALVVVNFLNRQGTGGEGERASSSDEPQEAWATQVDALYELEEEDALDAFWLHDELERRRRLH